jgi:hypothetical protein
MITMTQHWITHRIEEEKNIVRLSGREVKKKANGVNGF